MQPDKYSRRNFLETSAMTATAAAFLASAQAGNAAPASQQQPTSAGLTTNELNTLAAYGDTLAPGARAAGITSYVSSQLNKQASDCLLMIRYLGVPPPYVALYKTWLTGLEATARQRHKKSFAALKAPRQKALADALASDQIDNWQGPPASFFHFVLRADATDVLYGTVDGFKRLDVPYLAHIAPNRNW